MRSNEPRKKVLKAFENNTKQLDPAHPEKKVKMYWIRSRKNKTLDIIFSLAHGFPSTNRETWF